MTTKDDTERQSLLHPDPKTAAAMEPLLRRYAGLPGLRDAFKAGVKFAEAGRWTPAGERLPDRTDGFEVTILAQCGTRSIRNSMFVVEKQVWYNVMPDSETVIAWREKSQPY